jgi:hypothetical protein
LSGKQSSNESKGAFSKNSSSCFVDLLRKSFNGRIIDLMTTYTHCNSNGLWLCSHVLGEEIQYASFEQKATYSTTISTIFLARILIIYIIIFRKWKINNRYESVSLISNKKPFVKLLRFFSCKQQKQKFIFF